MKFFKRLFNKIIASYIIKPLYSCEIIKCKVDELLKQKFLMGCIYNYNIDLLFNDGIITLKFFNNVSWLNITKNNETIDIESDNFHVDNMNCIINNFYKWKKS